MNVRHYKSRTYKLIALASHLGNSGAWPFYVQRIRRRLGADLQPVFTEEHRDAVYGRHVHDIGPALQAMGLAGHVRDPRTLYPALFESGREQIARLPIPFQDMGIAGESDLSFVYSAAAGIGARDILETGVALGWSSLALLKIAECTGGRLVSVDLPYPYLIGQSWVGIVVPDEMRRRWTLLRKADRIGIPRAVRLSEGFDFIHYDSDKSASGRRWAYPRLWNALRPGGLMMSDDVGDNTIWAEFCASVGVPLIVVRRKALLTGIARKPIPAAQRNGTRREA